MRTLVAVQMGRGGAYELNISALWGQSRFLQLFVVAYISVISRKSDQYCKRLKQIREEADALMMQSEFDVPTVESLMTCPISRFIHFAANECGYKGT